MDALANKASSPDVIKHVGRDQEKCYIIMILVVFQ